MHDYAYCNMDKLINWTELSRNLSGHPTSIRSNKIPKKYEKQVHDLLNRIHVWAELNKKK